MKKKNKKEKEAIQSHTIGSESDLGLAIQIATVTIQIFQYKS